MPLVISMYYKVVVWLWPRCLDSLDICHWKWMPFILTVRCRISLRIQWFVKGIHFWSLSLLISSFPEALLFWVSGGEMSRPLHTSALNSPPHTLHHRSARSPSVLVQSTRFHLQTSSQLPYKHDRLSDFLGTLLIVVYIAVTVKEWCRLFGLDSSLDGAGWLSLAVVASSTNEPNVAPIFQ